MGLFSKKTKDKKEEVKESEKVAEKEVKEETESTDNSMKDLYSDSGKVKKGSKAISHTAYKVLIKPLITEKVTELGAQNKYVFAVSRSANKIEIAKAIQGVYGIKPESVNIINIKGKKVSRGKITGKRKDWKKAIVTLPEGKTIQVYEGV